MEEAQRQEVEVSTMKLGSWRAALEKSFKEFSARRGLKRRSTERRDLVKEAQSNVFVEVSRRSNH